MQPCPGHVLEPQVRLQHPDRSEPRRPDLGSTPQRTLWGKDPAHLEGHFAKFLPSDRVLGEGSVSPATMNSNNGF